MQRHRRPYLLAFVFAAFYGGQVHAQNVTLDTKGTTNAKDTAGLNPSWIDEVSHSYRPSPAWIQTI
ncbi:MAG: hypothetical protein L0Y72_17605 [Gemmataceae bacterium]|nr:hypothetical protein [Gemmataceae bacterium]MCI0740868.1 hypothetical protein [Gemmataceae bacterium]